MVIKNPAVEIVEDDPFRHDVLNRKESAEVLTQLLSTITEPFVLAIDSEWGTGKTTFVRMWQKHLENGGYPCLYFNAWENDFAIDPLVAFIGEINAGMDQLKIPPDRLAKAKELFEKAKSVGTTIARHAIPIALKLGTAGVLDMDAFTEKTLADCAGKLAQDKIEQYQADKLTITKFKESLQDFVAELGSDTEKKFPLIFFIDELDRCRPTYAVELLERIKHLFSIDGIIFVLAIDKEQMGHSVSALYGAKMNSDGYLRRFIDLDYALPQPSIESFANYLFNRFGLDALIAKRLTREKHYERERILTTFTNFSHAFRLTLRVQEQCFSRFNIALRTTPPDYDYHPILLTALIVVKVVNPVLYRKYISRIVTQLGFIDYLLDQLPLKDFMSSNYGVVLESEILLAACKNREEISTLKELYALKMTNSKTDNEKERARIIHSDIDNAYSPGRYYGFLDYVVQRIEITSQFVN